jgi:radical SAM enzyme (TIGR01210 family)
MSLKHYIIPIFVPHYGCPHQCSFCNQRSISGAQNKITSNDVKQIIEEHIRTISSDAEIEIAFYGGSFTGIPVQMQEELLKSAKEYIDQKKVLGIRVSTRPDYIDIERLDLLKKYGVKIIELGVQSMDQQVLDASLRGHTANQVREAAKLIKENGFTLGVQIMIGLPEDTLEKDIKTAKELIKLQPDIARIYPVLVIKGTRLAQLYQEGKYSPITLENAVEIGKELLKLFRKNDINVIRMGLQTSENINEKKDIVAGPFHPAYKELVESALRLDMIVEAIKKMNYTKNNGLMIEVNPAEVSITVGHNKENVNKLCSKYGFKQVKVIGNKEVMKDNINVFSC